MKILNNDEEDLDSDEIVKACNLYREMCDDGDDDGDDDDDYSP